MAVFSFPEKRNIQLTQILTEKPNINYMEAMPAECLMDEAQRLLNKGQKEKAVELMRNAQKKLYNKQDVKIQELLVYPFLLQKADKKSEGWMEFMNIKEYYYSLAEDNAFLDSMLMDIESSISSAMCKFLQNDYKTHYAVYMSVKSYLEDLASTFYTINTHMQKEIVEKNPAIKEGYRKMRKQSENFLNLKISESYINNAIVPALIKARKKEVFPSMLLLVKEHIGFIPKIDYIHLEEDIMALIRK